jgi:hypothetical protein
MGALESPGYIYPERGFTWTPIILPVKYRLYRGIQLSPDPVKDRTQLDRIGRAKKNSSDIGTHAKDLTLPVI